jgi:DNA polymerase I-like protein with 3'-5' exonuclease and polymerase domains/uracil-DNA glycosylase
MPIQGSGRLDAKVLIVGEFPHENDLRRGEPFIGGIGFELSKMLQEAGIPREQCYMTMVMKDRVYGQTINSLIAEKKKDITPRHVLYKGKWVMPQVVDAVEALRAEIQRINPNVVCTSGNLALWALTGEWSSFSWRSSVMESTLIPGLKVIPTLSFGIVASQWSQRPIVVHDLKRVARESKTAALIDRNYKFLIPTDNSPAEFSRVHAALWDLIEEAADLEFEGSKLLLGGDIETRAGHISCIAFAKSKTDAVCIPLMKTNQPEGFWTAEQEAELVMLMCRLMSRVTIIGQNWNYDAQYIFRHWHFMCPSVVDTMIQQHSCFSNLPKNLAFLSSMYCDDHLYWKDDRTNWKEGQDGEGEIQYWRYNCTDAARTLAIHHVLVSVSRGMGLDAVNEFQQELRQRVLKTMIRGVRVDHKRRAEFSFQLMDEVARREQWMQAVLGHTINIKSPKQMADFFYRQMGQREIISRKTGGVTTNEEALHRIAHREPILLPITRKISELRSLGVFHSTFVQAGLDIDGRMRCTFNVAGTETYRFSSSQNAFDTGMNMQNIPKGGETEDEGLDLPNVRTLFIPDPGMTMFDLDLDSADLHIVTWESDCQWMKENFRAGRKPYVEVMKEYYHDQSMSKNSHPREYAMFKSLCHGTNYLGTADGIAPRIGLLVHETERIQKWYFSLCPEIAKWQEDIKKQVSGRRYVENAFGYRNYFFDRIEGTIFNQAVAWIPQSTVACLINRAWAAIEDNMPEAEMLIQVHDSLVGQVPTAQKATLLPRIAELATVPIPYPDPLMIPVGFVSSERSWGECS